MKRKLILLAIAGLLLFTFHAIPALAQPTDTTAADTVAVDPEEGKEGAKAIAVVTTVRGNAELKKGEAEWAAATFGTVLDDGDKVRTGEDGFVALIFTDDRSQLKIRPNTTLTMYGERDEDYSIAKRVNMELGELLADVQQQKGSLQVATPTSVASVKGTEFWVVVQVNGETQVLTLEGLVELLNLSSGQTVEVSAGNQALSDLAGMIQTGEITEDQIPEFIQDNLEAQEIEIRFRDDSGEEKTLIIRFQGDEGGGE